MTSFGKYVLAALVAALTDPVAAYAQQLAPGMGYMYPSGVAVGQTIEVILGGYDWTPDMQVFVHDARIKLELVGVPGPVTVPEPPYWFGKKARRNPDPLPREVKAKLTVPANVPPGIYEWQAANANGVTKTGRFVVSNGPELVEQEGRKQPQILESLPVTVSGRVKIVEEVDRYRFKAPANGLVTCVLTARAFGSVVNAVLEVRDSANQLVADAADTAGNDTAATFTVTAGQEYTVSIFDLDFRGDRAYTYRLSVSQGPRVVTAIPASGKRGETRSVEFVGYGVATGSTKLESVSKSVTFPSDPEAKSFGYSLETPFGKTPAVSLLLNEVSDSLEPATADIAGRQLAIPAAITGVIDEMFGEDRFRMTGKKGDVWAIQAVTQEIGSPLDVSLALFDSTGKELVRSDDAPGTVDATLAFTVPADGEYLIAVNDISGQSGDRSGTYRLTAETPQPGFTIGLPDLLAVQIGAKGNLPLRVTRTGGFNDPITVTMTGLPAGVTVPPMLQVAMAQGALNIELTAPADIAATASLVTVTAEATVAGKPMKQTAGPTLVATTIKAPFAIDAEGLDDVTKWPRGSTFPGPVLIERDANFNGEILLEMHSRQGRVVQGIWGPEMTVAPGEKRVLYPIYLPEWLETTRTSRMVVNGVAKIPDPKGNVRHVSYKLKTRIGFLPGGALMKLATGTPEVTTTVGSKLNVPLTISRTNDLKEELKLELVPSADQPKGLFTAETLTIPADKTSVEFPIAIAGDAAAAGEHEVTIRATLMQNDKYAVISETKVLVILK